MRTNVSMLNLIVAIILVAPACTVNADGAITSFNECVAAGNIVLRSYPARCVTKDGRSFVDDSAVQVIPLKDPLLEEPSDKKKGCEDLCGNGSCEMMVCMAVGCPCPESKQSCPVDCKE